ncbi:MAG: hypothetical protein P8I99_04035 [Acidimicrobiales bacterium]|nr:hypothetical protein [Acidimicrobiales bacterium]
MNNRPLPRRRLSPSVLRRQRDSAHDARWAGSLRWVGAALLTVGMLAGCRSPDTPELEAHQEFDEALNAAVDSNPEPAKPTAAPQPDEPEAEHGLVLRAGVGEIVVDRVVDGVVVERRALIVVPQDSHTGGDPESAAATLHLLVALHGNGGRPEGMLRDFQPFIDQGRFIALIPEGLERSWNLGR